MVEPLRRRQRKKAATDMFSLKPPRHSPTLPDIVAKVFLGWRTKILRSADALYARQREGPYRFIQNRLRTSVVALKSDAAAEKFKDQLSRGFPEKLLEVAHVT
jgi:hypothetical protein